MLLNSNKMLDNINYKNKTKTFSNKHNRTTTNYFYVKGFYQIQKNTLKAEKKIAIDFTSHKNRNVRFLDSR